MIAMAARRRYLVGAGVALAVIAVLAAVLVVVTTDDGTVPAPEFTLNSTTQPIPDGVLGGGGSCTTITRSRSGDGVGVHLLSSCRMQLPSWIQLPGTTPARSLWIGESEAAPAHQASPQERPVRPQSVSPESFRGLPGVVVLDLPDLSARPSYRELREALERLHLSVRRDLQQSAFTMPTEPVVLYFQ